MIAKNKIEIFIKRMALISVIYGFLHVEIFDEIAIYLIVVSIQFLISILILNYLNPYESILINPLILLASLIISSIAFWSFFEAAIYLKPLKNTVVLAHWVVLPSSLFILLLSLFKFSKSYIMTIKKSDKTRRIEIVLLGACFVLNLMGIFLNIENVLFSIILFGLGLTILSSPILLLNFIFLNINFVYKWHFISYLVLTNSITLFIILLDTNSVSYNISPFGKLFGDYDFIWPTINIVTGVIWTILLLLQQKTGSKDNVNDGRELKAESQTSKI
jgi:hypothetical protein